MAKPTKDVRRGVYERDDYTCVSCGRMHALSFQHRRATGWRGSKELPTLADGLTACIECNMRFEGDLQDEALAKGWKVRSWVRNPALVPYFHEGAGRWYVITDDAPVRRAITRAQARELMLAVYGSDGGLPL